MSRAAIIGVSELLGRRVPQHITLVELLGLAGREALLDAQLLPVDVDGLLVAPNMAGSPLMTGAKLAEYLGISAEVATSIDLGGATAAGMAWRAQELVESGRCRAVLGLLGEVLDPARPYLGSGREWSGDPRAGLDRPYGYLGPNCGYAMVAMRHEYEYGTTAADRALVVVAQRTNALGLPDVVVPDEPLSVEAVLASPVICDPLHRLEIVRPVSGAYAFVLAGPHRAHNAGVVGARVGGAGERTDHSGIAQARSLTSTTIPSTAGAAFTEAGLGPNDMDALQLYDCYSITVLLALEGAGFCPPGTSGRFVADHDLTWKGDLPVNTNGGQLNVGQAGYAGGATHLVEAVRQLRGTAGHQVADCEHVFVHGNGGTLSYECSIVLSREER
jgi:acetyl-CoA acetyltransferase